MAVYERTKMILYLHQLFNCLQVMIPSGIHTAKHDLVLQNHLLHQVCAQDADWTLTRRNTGKNINTVYAQCVYELESELGNSCGFKNEIHVPVIVVYLVCTG